MAYKLTYLEVLDPILIVLIVLTIIISVVVILFFRNELNVPLTNVIALPNESEETKNSLSVMASEL